MVMPIWLAPFNNVTVLLASAVPAMSIEGAVFCEGAVVTMRGALGAVWSSCMTKVFDAPLIWPAESVAVAVKL
jgi:hypothetical protein